VVDCDRQAAVALVRAVEDREALFRGADHGQHLPQCGSRADPAASGLVVGLPLAGVTFERLARLELEIAELRVLGVELVGAWPQFRQLLAKGIAFLVQAFVDEPG
jgi:hypothetical protein